MLSPSATPVQVPEGEDTSVSAWQQRLLPLMARMLIGLTVFFFLASFGQLFYLHSRIENAPTMDYKILVRTVLPEESVSEFDRRAIQQLNVAAALEKNVIERRYHQANVLLMSRVWTNYLGFVTGMTLALVGAAFILGQLRTPESELKSSVPTAPMTLRTASPGLVLCVLGVVLMITTIVTNHAIETRDTPAYFNPLNKSDRPDLPFGSIPDSSASPKQ